jgi:putative transposase
MVPEVLEAHDIVYCFLDAIYLKLHPDDTPAEGVLVCWGVTLEGRKVLLGLALGSRESTRPGSPSAGT